MTAPLVAAAHFPERACSEPSHAQAPDHLVVRRLHTTVANGFAKEWNGKDAFLPAFCNALSMTFPAGEQFFIESAREASKHLPDTPANAVLQATVRDFIGQEATHRRVHELYNAELERQGYKNFIGPRLQKRIANARKKLFSSSRHPHMHELAITTAYEHMTAILGYLTLERIGKPGDWFANVDTDMQTIWRWHAAEEWEHKCVTFDIYRALNGNHVWRQRWYSYVLMQFAIDIVGQTVRNLWHMRCLHKPSTWASAWRHIFSNDGLLARSRGMLQDYRREDFDPLHAGHATLASDWLQANAGVWSPVVRDESTSRLSPAPAPQDGSRPMGQSPSSGMQHAKT